MHASACVCMWRRACCGVVCCSMVLAEHAGSRAYGQHAGRVQTQHTCLGLNLVGPNLIPPMLLEELACTLVAANRHDLQQCMSACADSLVKLDSKLATPCMLCSVLSWTHACNSPAHLQLLLCPCVCKRERAREHHAQKWSGMGMQTWKTAQLQLINASILQQTHPASWTCA